MDKKQMRIYEFRADMLKALANPTRLAIIDYLVEEERCVCDIVEYLGEKQSSVSRHLATLRNAGIVETRKEGLKVFYSLKTPCIRNFFACTDKIIKEQHEEKGKIIKSL